MKKQIPARYFIKQNVIEGWKFIKQNRRYIYFSIGIFVFFFAIAMIFPVPSELDSSIKEILKQILIKTLGLNGINLIAFIFNNNLTASFTGLFAGFIFGIIPFLFAASNGYMLGYVIKSLIGHLGILNGVFSLWRLLPHGIFELPAIFISIGLGLRLGISFITSLNNSNFRILWGDLKNSLRVLIFIVIPLLVLAAIIEGSLISLMG